MLFKKTLSRRSTDLFKDSIHYIPQVFRNLKLLYILAFIQVLSTTLFTFGLPNILIFDLHEKAQLVGFIISSYTLSFIVGPTLLHSASKRLGIRNSLLISVSISMICIGLQVFFFSVVMLLILSITNGIFASIFWPNLESAMSQLQKFVPEKEEEKITQNFGLSWNLGAIFGEFVGFIVLFLGSSNYFIIILSWAIATSQILIARIIVNPKRMKFPKTTETTEKKDSKIVKNKNNENENNGELKEKKIHNKIDKINKIILKKSKSKAKEPQVQISRYLTILFPAILIFLGETTFQIIKSLYDFSYPFILKSNSNSSQWTYFVFLFQQIFQILAIFWAGRLKPMRKFRSFIIGIVGTLVFTLFAMFRPTPLNFGITIAMIGFFGGLLYSFSAELLFKYGKRGNSLRYTTMYETFSSLGYGIVPLIAGYIAEINFMTNFLILSIFLLCMLIFIVPMGIIASRKKKKIILNPELFPIALNYSQSNAQSIPIVENNG